MLSTVVSSLFSRLIDAFPADRSYSRHDFSREPMPGPVSDYITESMNARALDSVQVQPAWVDLGHSEIKEAQQAYVDAVSRHLRVPAEAWPGILGEACRQTVSYLIRPATTLTEAVFANGPHPISPDTVFARMKPYSSYPYFREVVGGYFDQKGVDSIDRERFASLVQRIDRQMTSDYGSQEWLRLLEPLFSLAHKVPELSGGIPVELLRIFFDEKQARDLVLKVDRRFPQGGVAKESHLPSLFEPDEINVHREASILKPEHATEVRPLEARAPDRVSGPLPLWKQYERVQPAVSSEARETLPVSGSPEPLWKKFRKEPESPSELSTLSQLEHAVLGERGARNRDLFVNHLFAGKLEEYERTLGRLREAANWSQASQIIAQEVFLRHKVNIYSEPAVAFTDAAEAQYR